MRFKGVVVALVACAVLLSAASSAGATTFTVTNGDNTGTGSLRDAINQAETNNNDPTVDLIQFMFTGSIGLDSPQISISHPLTIEGPGPNNLNITRSGSATTQFRFFAVTPATGNTVTLRNLTISGARATGFAGGALTMSGLGTLIIDSVVFDDNHSGQGGAVFYDRGFTSIRNSTLTDNEAAFGGAIVGGQFNPNVGNGDIVNSTIVGNKATEFGGGVYTNVSHIQILSSTIVGNTADSDSSGGGDGGGTYNGGPDALSFSVANTIYAGNQRGMSSPVASQCGGDHTSSGYNLRQTAEVDCTGFTATGDTIEADPKLGTLGGNGGPTPTIPLVAGSPALEAGNPDTPIDGFFPACPTADQRGVSRLGDNRCDIGAFEKRSPTTTTVACSPTALTLGSGSSTCTATVTDVVGLSAPTGNVSFKTDASGAFSSGGVCALSALGDSPSCSVTYTPTAIGTHTISAFYDGTADFEESDGSDEISVGTVPTPVAPGATGTTFDLKAAIKKCKRKFPKGQKRKKCIKRAKKRAQG